MDQFCIGEILWFLLRWRRVGGKGGYSMQMVFDDVHDVQSPTLGDMDVEALRRYGHQVIDWITTYLTSTERYPILSRAVPGGIRSALPQQAPEQPEKMEDILEDMNRLVVPGISHWNSEIGR